MFLAAMAVAGVALQAYGQIKAANDQAEAMQRKAMLDGFQANELLRRQEYNAEILRQKEGVAEGEAGAMAGSSGGGNLGIGAMLRLRHDLKLNLESGRQEAEYTARMIRLGADVDMKLGSDVQTAGYLGATGSILTGAAKVYEMNSPKGNNQSLKGSGSTS
jgi:hypothetical protein